MPAKEPSKYARRWKKQNPHYRRQHALHEYVSDIYWNRVATRFRPEPWQTGVSPFWAKANEWKPIALLTEPIPICESGCSVPRVHPTSKPAFGPALFDDPWWLGEGFLHEYDRPEDQDAITADFEHQLAEARSQKETVKQQLLSGWTEIQTDAWLRIREHADSDSDHDLDCKFKFFEVDRHVLFAAPQSDSHGVKQWAEIAWTVVNAEDIKGARLVVRASVGALLNFTRHIRRDGGINVEIRTPTGLQIDSTKQRKDMQKS
jgi:hypothetical protein